MSFNSAPQPAPTATLESESDELQKLSSFLSANQDKKVTLSWSPQANRFGLLVFNGGQPNFIGEDLISASNVDHDEIGKILSDLINKYHATNPDKYKEPAWNSKTNSATEETMAAASFIIKDLLADLNITLEKKA